MRLGHPPDALYAFKHVMIQNAAHASPLHSERCKLHSRIAQLLAEMYPEKTAREPELLAHHLTESGQSEGAESFWLKAGKQAARTGANLEARRGLGVVQANARMQGADEDRARSAHRVRQRADRGQGLCGAGGRGELHARARARPAARR